MPTFTYTTIQPWFTSTTRPSSGSQSPSDTWGAVISPLPLLYLHRKSSNWPSRHWKVEKKYFDSAMYLLLINSLVPEGQGGWVVWERTRRILKPFLKLAGSRCSRLQWYFFPHKLDTHDAFFRSVIRKVGQSSILEVMKAPTCTAVKAGK